MKPVNGSCCSLYRPIMGRNECLFPIGQSGAQTFRLIVSCHCQYKTKVCDLSMCNVKDSIKV